jgi:hypothetical protein
VRWRGAKRNGRNGRVGAKRTSVPKSVDPLRRTRRRRPTGNPLSQPLERRRLRPPYLLSQKPPTGLKALILRVGGDSELLARWPVVRWREAQRNGRNGRVGAKRTSVPKSVDPLPKEKYTPVFRGRAGLNSVYLFFYY